MSGMADQPLSVIVELHCLQSNDSIPLRRILLEEPYWYARIGRGTKTSGHDLKPKENNAWFESKVMSRHHAALSVNAVDKTLFIEDIGSTHGTYLDGRKLSTNHRERLRDGDIIVFGADVTHKSSHFPALKTRIAIKWSDDQTLDTDQPSPDLQIQNFFSADFDDEDQPSDSDIDVIREVIRHPSIEVVLPPRTFSVPDSDISEAGSSDDSSVQLADHEESPTSSPPGVHYDGKETDDANTREYESIDDEDDVEEEETSEDDLQLPVEEDEDQIDTNYEDSDIFDNEDIDHLDPTSTADIDTSSPISPTNQLLLFPPPAVKVSPSTSTGMVFPIPAARTPSPSDAAMVKPKQGFTQSPQPKSYIAPAVPWMNQYMADLDIKQPEFRDKDRLEDFTSWLFDAGPDHRSKDVDDLAHAKSIQNRMANLSSHINTDIHHATFTQTWAGPSTVHGRPLERSHADIITAAAGSASTRRTPPARKITVSLSDILNRPDSQTVEPELSENPLLTLKRKADRMDDGPDTNEDKSITQSTDEHYFPDAQLVDDVDDHDHDVLVPDSILLHHHHHQQFLDNSPTEEQQQQPPSSPPRKKAKKDRHHVKPANTVAKYAVTALAGVAVGAVGTIFGLAALPADYFT